MKVLKGKRSPPCPTSSLGCMKVTTWIKRRQRERQAVSREVEVIEPRNMRIGVVDMLINMEDKIRWDKMGCFSGRSRGLRAWHVSKVTK